jgi:hypothetical protein
VEAQPEGKAADYYRILERNPRPGYLFERFRDAWLEQGDLSELETFLEQEGEELLLAFHFEAGNETARAADIYTRLLADRPDWPQVLYYNAEANARLGFYSKTEADLEKLVATGPVGELKRKALALLGRTQVRTGKSEEGVATWARMLVDEGLDSDVADDLLDLLMAEGLYDKALAHSDCMLAATKDAFRGVELRMRRAAILVRLDRRNDAVDGLREAFGLAGQGSWLRRDLLARIDQLYRGADDLSGLCECYAAMRASWPNAPELMKKQAEAQMAVGKNDAALETARALVVAMPGDRAVREWYAARLLELGKAEEAIPLLEDFLVRFPDDNELRLQLAGVDDARSAYWILEFLAHSDGQEADYLRAARELKRFELQNEATSVYTEMLAKWPESLEGREAIALHLTRRGSVQPQLAMKHYEWLAERCEIEMLLRLSKALLAVNDTEDAVRLLAMRTDDFGNDIRFVTAQYEAVFAQGRFDDAMVIGLRRVDLAQGPEEMDRAASQLVYLLKQQKKTAEWLKRLADEADRSPGRSWLLASLYLEAHDPDAARALLADDPELHPCRLMLARRMSDWELLETMLIQLVEVDPKSKARWLRELVAVLQRTGKNDGALEWIGVWKEASPNATRPYEMERDVLMAANRPGEAVAAMRRAVARFDGSKELKRGLGRLYETTNRIKEAEQLYWRMLNAEENLSDRLSFLSDLIRVAQTTSRLDLLIEELERRAENSSTALFPLMGLVECHRAARDTSARNEVLERVLELRPNDVAVLREKARMEEDLGNYAAARDLMLRIAEADASGGAFRMVVEYELLFGDEREAARLMEDKRFAQDADGIVAVAESLLAKGCLPLMAEALAAHAAKPGAELDLLYLHALAQEESGQSAAAVEAFGKVLQLEDDGMEVIAATFIPGYASSPSSRIYRSGTWSRLADEVDGDLATVLQSLDQSNTAYGYRNRYRSSRYGGTSWRPGTLPVAKQYALAHIRNLLSGLNGDEALALVEGIEMEMPYARLLLIPAESSFTKAEWWEQALTFYPESEDLVMLRLAAAPQSLKTEEEIRAALAALPDGHPKIAFRAVWTAMGTHTNLVELLPSVAEPLMNDKDDLMELLQTVRSVAFSKDVPPETKQLLARIGERAEAMEGFPEEELFQLHMAQALMDEDYAAVVGRMQKMFHREESGAGLAGSMAYRSSSANLQFPPRFLFDSEMNVLSGLRMGDERMGDGLREALREVTDDDLFRLLALVSVGISEEETQQGIERIEAQETWSMDERLTLAGWYADKEPLQALEHVLAIGEQNKDAAYKPMVGQVLLSLASATDEIPARLQPRLKVQLETVIPAAKADNTKRRQLLGLMDSLGMPLELLIPEAKDIMVSSKPTPPKQTARRATDPYSHFRALADAGRTDAALEHVALMLRQEAQGSIYQASPSGNTNYHLTNCMREVLRRKLDAELLAMLKPNEPDPDPRRLFEYGFACEMLSDHAKALEALGQLHEMRPLWRGATVRYCMLLALEDPDAAQAIAASFSADFMEGVVSAMTRTMQGRTVSHEQRLAMCRLVVRLLQQPGMVDPQRSQTIYMALQQSLANNSWYQDNRSSLPALFSVEEEGVLAPAWKAPAEPTGNQKYLADEALIAIQQERRGLFLDMCTAMAESERSGQQGFALLTRYLDHVGQEPDGEALRALCEKVIRAGARSTTHFSFGSSVRGKKVEPITYYLTGLHRAGQMEKAHGLLEEIGKDSPFHASIKSLLDIHEAESGTNYCDKVEEAFEAVLQTSDYFAALLALHRLDGRTDDLDPFLEAYIRSNSDRLQYTSVSAVIGTWIDSKQDPDEVVRIIRLVLEASFSEQERAAIAAATDGGIGSGSQGRIYQQYSQLSMLFRGLQFPTAALPGVVEVMVEYDRKMENGGAAANLVRTRLSGVVQYEWLEAFGFLDPFETFRFYELPNQSQSLFDQLLSRMNASQRDEFKGRLMELEEQTFGTGLVSTLLENPSSNQRPQAVFDYLAGYADAIAANPDGQIRLFSWLESLEEYCRTSATGGESNTVHALYAEWKQLKALERLELLNGMPLAKALGNWNHWQTEWGHVSRALAESHPDEVAGLFNHMARYARLVSLANGRTTDSKTLLRGALGNPQYTVAEAHLAIRLAAALGDESADGWLSEYNRMLGYQMFDRIERAQRAKGLDYKESRLEAAKQTLTILLSGKGGNWIDGLQNTVGRVDRNDYEKLAAWLAEQELPDSDSKRLVEFYLAGKESDVEWFKAFLVDDSKEVGFRFGAFGWLGTRGSSSPAGLDDPAVLLKLLDLLEKNATSKLPFNVYWALIQHVESMDADGQEELGEQLLALWDHDRVAISRTDRNTLWKVAGLAGALGMDERATEYLSNPELTTYPQTYAIALRCGLDAFVAEQLPRKLLGLRNEYHFSDVWITKAAAARREALAAQIDDPAMSLLAELFIGVLRVEIKSNSYSIDTDALTPLLKRAADELKKPEHLQWVVSTMNDSRIKNGMEPLNRRYAESSTILEVLRKNDGGISASYVAYLDELAAETNLVRLAEIADQLVGHVGSDDVRSSYRKNICNAVVKHTIELGDNELMEKGIAIGLEMQRLENPDKEPNRADVFKALGIIEFDPVVYGLDIEDDVLRLDAYEAFDAPLRPIVQQRFEARCRQVAGTAKVDDDIRARVRREMVGDWIVRAGEEGFLPLCMTCGGAFYLYRTTPEHRTEFHEWLSSKGDSVMIQQFKASLADIQLQTETEGAVWEEDLRRYLGNGKVDVAERIRCLTDTVRRLGILRYATFHKVMVGSFSKADLKVYSRYADAKLEKIAERTQLEKVKKPGTTYGKIASGWALSLLPTLFDLERMEDALRLMDNTDYQLYLRPEAFALALEAGQSEWCARHLEDFATGYEPAKKHGILVPESEALKTLIEAEPDPDVRMAARVVFADLARSTSSHEALAFDGADPAAHSFMNSRCADQVNRLLKLRGVPKAPETGDE